MQVSSKSIPPQKDPSGEASLSTLILLTLDSLAKDQPDLARGCSYYQRLLPLLIEAQSGVDILRMDLEHAQEKINRGQPVMEGEEMLFHSSISLPLFFHLAEVMSEKRPGPFEKRWEEADRDYLAGLVEGALRGEEEPRQSLASLLNIKPSAVNAIASNCLKPFFHTWQKEISPGLDLSGWRKGSCPFCGSPPLLAELRGPQRARRLRCGLCGSDWAFSRLECAFCGSVDSHDLGLLQPEGQLSRMSVQTCGACQGYLKMVVTNEPIQVEYLPVEDLSTLQMDVIAARHGFSRPG